MLPERIRSSHVSHPTRTAVDAKLMERTGLDEFSLRRLRKGFMATCARMSYHDRLALKEGGIVCRFRLLVEVIRSHWPAELQAAWLQYLEHSEQDIAEMCRGEYPISPYLVRVHSALFGIKVDFLLMGAAPAADRQGANIDVWPLASTP